MSYLTRFVQIGLILALVGLALSACNTQPPVVTATPTPSATPLKVTETLQSTVTHSPTRTPTIKPKFLPTPVLKPTIDPTILPDRLMTGLRLVSEAGFNGHSTRRITGWDYGFAHPRGFYEQWTGFHFTGLTKSTW